MANSAVASSTFAGDNPSSAGSGNQVAEPLDRVTKKRLIVIAVISVILIIVVAILTSVVEWQEGPSSDDDDDGYYYQYGATVDYDGNVDYFCGTNYNCDRNESLYVLSYYDTCFTKLNETNCGYLCVTEPYNDYDVEEAFYLPDSGECYCFTYTDSYKIRSTYYDDTWYTHCENATDNEEVEHYYVSKYGRYYYYD